MRRDLPDTEDCQAQITVEVVKHRPAVFKCELKQGHNGVHRERLTQAPHDLKGPVKVIVIWQRKYNPQFLDALGLLKGAIAGDIMISGEKKE